MTEMTQALACPENQPQATFEALQKLVQHTIGAKLFTLMEVDHDNNLAWRNYSNMPDAYPVLGKKPRVPNRWTEIVDGQHETFVANSIEEIAEVFPDFPLIQSLGCESCLNLPIVISGKLRGTLNCLDVAGHYTPERVAAAQSLKEAGALAFLMAESLRSQGDSNG